MLLIILIIIPLVSGILSISSPRYKVLGWIAAIAAISEFIIGLAIVKKVIESGFYVTQTYFAADSLSAIFLLIIITVGLATSLYSIGYLKEETDKEIIGFRRVRQYFTLLHFFLLAMLFATITTNPIMMWVAIEATTLSTAFLISFYNKPSSVEAAWKYLIINSVGLLLAFFGTLMFFTSVYGLLGSSFITWNTLVSNSANLNPLIAKIAFIFVLIGYGTKVGFTPMHTWLPDAHSKAPAPISALLSGVLLSVALMAILRFRIIVNAAIPSSFTEHLFIFFGILSIVLASLIIFIQRNYKRLLAYSSIEHMGIAALGFGFGGIGVFAGLLHIIYHALAKPALFFGAGNIFLKYSSTKIAKIRGVSKVLPITSVLFILGFLAITGIPPFGLFMTKFYIISAGFHDHFIISIIALASLALVFAGFLRHIAKMSWGDPINNTEDKPGEPIERGESNILTVIPPLALISILIVLSIFIPAPLRFLIESAALLIK